MERLPVEFLFQGLSPAGAHKDAMEARTEDCLKFYDAIPGCKRLAHIDHVARQSGLTEGVENTGIGAIQEGLARLGLGINTKQVKVKAEVLPPPELRFEGRSESGITDGSWGLKDRFLRGSRFYSFSVIRSPDISDPDVKALFDEMHKVFGGTGIQIAFRTRMSDQLMHNVVDVDARTALPLDVSTIA